MSTDRATAEGTNVAEEEGADLAAELGFEPAVSATGADDVSATPQPPAVRARRRRRRRSALRRRLSAFAILAGALASMGGAYAAFAASSGAADSTDTAASIAQGKQLYEISCITCHGAEPGGRQEPGPVARRCRRRRCVLPGQHRTHAGHRAGRLRSSARPRSSTSKRPSDLATYVQSIGGGPAIPTGSLRGDDASIAEGGELFRQNCASCHGTTFKGAPLSAGKHAPSLNAGDRQADVRRDDLRSGEHAGLQQQPAHARRRRRRSSPTSRRSRRPTTRAAAASTASARCPRRSCCGSAVSACS